jgi:hypothetical protein
MEHREEDEYGGDVLNLVMEGENPTFEGEQKHDEA